MNSGSEDHQYLPGFIHLAGRRNPNPCKAGAAFSACRHRRTAADKTPRRGGRLSQRFHFVR